jgi:hypothetical protein
MLTRLTDRQSGKKGLQNQSNIAAQLLTDRATQVRDMFAGVQDFCFQIVW